MVILKNTAIKLGDQTAKFLAPHRERSLLKAHAAKRERRTSGEYKGKRLPNAVSQR